MVVVRAIMAEMRSCSGGGDGGGGGDVKRPTWDLTGVHGVYGCFR